MGISVLFFPQKETGTKRVVMATALRVLFFSFVIHIFGAKFQEHCFCIARDIVHSIFYDILVANDSRFSPVM